MSKHIMEDGSVITVKHIMADGTERDSIEGYFVPYNENTAMFYHARNTLLESYWRRQQAEKQSL